jgi:HNH endonuclease
MPKIEKTCECGQQFSTFPSQNSEHCSRACSSRFIPRKKRTGDTVPCEVCATPFYRNPTEAKKGRGRFCSRDCHNVAQTKVPVVNTCPVCGKERSLKPSQAGVLHCSRECQTLGRIKRPTGEIHNGRPVKLDAQGYRMIWEPSHPNKSMKGWQYEHRLVAEASLGRYLTSDEQVDHINEIKGDNEPGNLQVLSATDHSKKTVRDLWRGIEAMKAELAEYRRCFGPLEREE